MNRREAIKAAGAAFVTSIAGAASAEPRPSGEAQGPGGVFTVTMHGPSILHFPKNGGSARLHFTGFPHETVCPQPIHVPNLMIDATSAESTMPGQEKEDSWPIAGLSVEAVMDPADKFIAVDFDQEPNPSAKNPRIHPANDAEWKSLKWIPRLHVSVDHAKLARHTTAAVAMNRGRLEGMKPEDKSAQTALWLWTTPVGWRKAEVQLVSAPQAAMTDRIRLIGRYSGGEAVVTLRPLLNPTQTFEMRFKPKKAGGPVDVMISAEPPDSRHRADTRPLRLYCAYYNLAANTIDLDKRPLPYLSPVDFSGNPVPPAPVAADGMMGQPTPSPLCGSMKIIA